MDPERGGTRARHHLALIYLRQGRPREAETQWQTVLADQPDFMTGWVKLADLYADERRWDDLENMARRLDAGPRRTVEAALVRARGHMARQEFTSARQLLESAIAQAPQALWPRMALSHVLLLEGRDWAAAEKALREVLALDLGNNEARQNLGVLMRQTRKREYSDDHSLTLQ